MTTFDLHSPSTGSGDTRAPDPEATVIVPDADHPTVVVPDSDPTELVELTWSHDNEEDDEDEPRNLRAFLRGFEPILAVPLPVAAIIALCVMLFRAENRRPEPAAAPTSTPTAAPTAAAAAAPTAPVDDDQYVAIAI
jgi:hypothetical protein